MVGKMIKPKLPIGQIYKRKKIKNCRKIVFQIKELIFKCDPTLIGVKKSTINQQKSGEWTTCRTDGGRHHFVRRQDHRWKEGKE
jgi:hypothetical protein